MVAEREKYKESVCGRDRVREKKREREIVCV